MPLLSIIYLAYISLGLPDSLLGSAWPSMYTKINAPLHYAGFIYMIIAGCGAVSSIFSVRVIKRFGTGRVTAFSVLLTATGLMGISFSHHFLWMCLYAMPLGFGAGSVDAGLNNYVAVHYKARHMSWLHCFWGIGASIGPLIMSMYLIQKQSWSGGFRAISIIQFCLVAILFMTLPLWKNKYDKKYDKDTTDLQHDKKKAAAKHIDILRIAGVKQILVAFFCYCTIEAVTGLWGSSYLVLQRHIQPEIAARWIALYYVGITLGRFISGFITMKVNNKNMIRLGQTIIACGIVVLILPFGTHLLLPGLFMIGLGCAPIFPCMAHQTPTNFGTASSQAIMGMQMASAYTGVTVVPPLFGRIASTLSFNLFPPFLSLMLLLTILLVETVHKKVSSCNCPN